MSYVAQDLTEYFTNLKIQLKSDSRKSNIKMVIFLILASQIPTVILYFLLIDETALPNKDKLFYFISGGALFVSLLFSIPSYTYQKFWLIKTTDNVKLYDGLTYVYREQQKTMSEEDFTNLIDTEYERFKLQEILANLSTHRGWTKKRQEIEALYENKTKQVSAKSILIKEFSMD